MKQLSKAAIVGISAAGIGGIGLAATPSVLATGGGEGSSWWQGHVRVDDTFDAEVSAAIAAKFSLSEEEVAEVVEQVRDDHFSILDEDRQEKLQKALEDEKLTQEQYDHIVMTLTEIDALIDQVDDAEGWEERKELYREIKSEFKELKEWMIEQDLRWSILGLPSSHLWHHDRDHDDDRKSRQ